MKAVQTMRVGRAAYLRCVVCDCCECNEPKRWVRCVQWDTWPLTASIHHLVCINVVSEYLCMMSFASELWPISALVLADWSGVQKHSLLPSGWRCCECGHMWRVYISSLIPGQCSEVVHCGVHAVLRHKLVNVIWYHTYPSCVVIFWASSGCTSNTLYVCASV